MGYYTEYELKVLPEQEIHIDHKRLISELIDFWPFGQECKWYEYHGDMIEYSKKHPSCIFILKGVGEEHPDIWVAYFKNGKTYKEKAKIVFSDYNEQLLK